MSIIIDLHALNPDNVRMLRYDDETWIVIEILVNSVKPNWQTALTREERRKIVSKWMAVVVTTDFDNFQFLHIERLNDILD